VSGRAKRKFTLTGVEFRDSPIAGRGVFAKRRIRPGEFVVAYAPKQRKLPVDHPDAIAAAETKLSLLSEGRSVIVPDTSVPGGWLCNHSCEPNAAIFSDGEGRIQCLRPIEPGEEVTIFYGWVTRNEPGRDPCRCGAERCRGTINFDVGDEDAAKVAIEDGMLRTSDEALRDRLAEYAEFLRSIGHEEVTHTIAATFAAMKRA
jgi:hypothetical protein